MEEWLQNLKFNFVLRNTLHTAYKITELNNLFKVTALVEMKR
jgi:hypothetical protein